MGQGRFRGCDVGLVLSPPDVRFCALRVPKKALEQSERRVREALAWEMAREMRSDAQSLEVRHWQLPPGHQQGLNVMAVALPAARPLDWFQLLARERLHLRRIDVSPCSLVHLACRTWTPADRELWGILDLGFRGTTLTVVLGTVPVYIRSLSASSNAWTQRLAQAFELPPVAAEHIKRAQGIRPGDRGVRPRRGDQFLLEARDIPAVIFAVLRESLDELVHEVNRCFAYTLQNFADADASRLFLAGGGANLSGLAEYLGMQLGLSMSPLGGDGVEEAEPGPLSGTKISPEEATVVGSALMDVEAA